MDLHGLEYIVEIAKVQNLSRAAENLFITQSTLSQHLTKLEGELGLSLFERKKNKMSITPAGKMYVTACKQILQEKKNLYNQLSDLDNAKTGSFTVGITPQWGAVAISHIIKEFKKDYPSIQVKVEEQIALPLTHLLKDGIVDMAILPLSNSTSLPYKGILLQSEELILAIPKAHIRKIPLHKHDLQDDLPQILVKDLAGEPMIFSKSQTTIRPCRNNVFPHSTLFLILSWKLTVILLVLSWYSKDSAVLLYLFPVLRLLMELFMPILSLPYNGM